MTKEAPYDLLSPAFQANPFPEFDRMRAHGPLVRTKLPLIGETWLAVTHEACAALLKNQAGFVRDARNAGKNSQLGLFNWLPMRIKLLADNMLGHDDPRHRRLRGLVDQAFQRRGIEALKPMITKIADDLIDRFDGRSEVDLIAEFCRDLPLSVICAMLGLPQREHDRFKVWMGGIADTANAWAVIRAFPGILKVVGYMRNHAHSNEIAPEGLIAALREAEIDGERLSEDELASMVFLLFAAGQETTSHLIAGGILTLLANPGELRRLLDDPGLMPSCIEECLRHVSPVQMSKPRFVVDDMEFLGERLRRGEMIMALLAAANCDPAKFENPHRFDIGRHPNPHLSFGTGVHFCLGFQLARAEARIAFERLLSRYPGMRLVNDPLRANWRKRFGLRSLASLPVRLIG